MARAEKKTERWDAELYDGKHAFVWELAKDLVPLLAPKAGERILDIGCGTGHLTAEIAASGAEVLGIDRSEEMIAEARKKHPEVRFEVMDAREIAFEMEFDGVFSNATLHWIREPERVIAGIARALRPGGRFVAEKERGRGFGAGPYAASTQREEIAVCSVRVRATREFSSGAKAPRVTRSLRGS